MNRPNPLRSAAWLIGLVLVCLLVTLLPAATPARAATTLTLELESIADARIQAGSPDIGFGGGFIWIGTPNGHLAYVQFDLATLPVDATITGAELRLAFQGQYDGAANAELGINDSAWDEATITWNTRPTSTFSGLTRPVPDDPALVTWDVAPIVRRWHSGATPNYGFALKGDGLLKAFHSRETKTPPVLALRYTIPAGEGGRPDFGDAPDSSNSLGVSPNTAYSGVAGNFPTVWAGTPAGEPAGPRHANPDFEGVLGNTLSREQEADSGNDADGRTNILDGGADNADNDRADDGWRNPSVPFTPCQPTTLRVRVSRGPSAQLERMFLNVWRDGNRDGDWDDRDLCTPPNEALAIPAHEWIVQNYYVDMTGIPRGGYVDIDVPTLTVLDTTPGQRHWMRFTLSGERAPESASGRADGRGPHPDQGSYRFGETEDVLQRPGMPGEDGALELRKRVVNPTGDPLPIGGLITYEIQLRHVGGTQPLQAQIRDAIPENLRIFPQIVSGQIEYIVVGSATGGATPLQAAYELEPGSPLPRYIVKWQGTLLPDSEVTLSFLVQNLGLCEPNQAIREVTNVAEARPRGGSPISAEATHRVACPGYNPRDLELTPVEIEDPIDLDDLTQPTWQAEVWNRHDFPVRVGFYTPGNTLITQDNASGGVDLGPNERKTVRFNIPRGQGGTDPLEQIGDPAPIEVGFCFLLPESDACPDPERYPHHHGDAPPATQSRRSNDLGDAPDSTNHAGAAMVAYPGVPASFPTVFDPATGAAQGPRHVTPRPFHLGERVSLEAEADLGPDQDPLNNIVPAANDPDNDRADDGSRLGNLVNCQPTTAEVKIFVSPAALAWFQQQGTPAYLNAWVDSNRDGDWDDGTSCGGGPDGGGPPALEHILIDQQINVVALGAGLHALSFNTGRVPWPAAQADKPAWVRFTLSEQPANKTLTFAGINYGDGRGYAAPFRTGETEDHLLRAQGGADLGVGLRGRIAPAEGGNERFTFVIDYANHGDRPAAGGTLTLAKFDRLRDPEIRMLRAPGIPPANIVETPDAVTITLPDLPPGAERTLMLGWEIPASPPPAGGYGAEVVASLAGDTAPENNRATVTIAPPATPLRLAIEASNQVAWGTEESTCSNFVRFKGQSELNRLYTFFVDGAADVDVVASLSPWGYVDPDLPDGIHELWFAPNPQLTPPVQSNSVRVNVDTSLPVDPITLLFTDSAGRSYHPPTLSWSRLSQEVAALLRPGETYTVEIDSCLSSPNPQVELALPGGDTITMSDADGDRRYTGSFVFNPGGAPAGALAAGATTTSELQLRVRSGSTEQRFSIPVQPLAPGIVRDANGGQTLAGVTVTALAAGTGGSLPAAATGGRSTAITGADGGYSFSTMGGAFRLQADRVGYQPYRSWDLMAVKGVLAQELRLTPEIPGATAHTVYLTADGFVPAQLAVAAGDVVEWVNLDQVERGVRGGPLDSGALAPGESYRARLSAAGSFTVTDPASPDSVATISVDGGGGGLRVFLPVVRR